MLSIEQILLIQRLLESGELSQREIAEVAKVSRSSVYNVTRGQIAALRPRRSKPLTTWTRCPRCGGMTMGPCLLCRARTHRALDRIDAPTPNNPNPRRAA
jgi:hypothetical protein